MIFVYLDWNVMSQMKSGHHEQLKEFLGQNDRVITFYSTSHISDIFSSYKEDDHEQLKVIEEDLEFISSITHNCFLSNDGEAIRIGYRDPKEVFNEKVEDKDLFKNFDLDSLTDVITEDHELEKLWKTYASLLKSMPLDPDFKKALNSPESSDQLNKMFPGLKDNPTMGGFFSSFGKMMTDLNEGEGYKTLRELVQSGLKINRDKLFDSATPYENIDKAYKDLGVDDFSQFQQPDKNGPKWFNEIYNAYVRLDMHGYQEDRISTKKGRKETYSNTTEDSFHAGFGSTCNYYIINDKKAYKKTSRVYEKLKLNTFVFKPEQFLEYSNEYLIQRTYDIDLQIPLEYLKYDPDTEEQIDEKTLRTYHVPHFLFDFFNKMVVVLDQNGVADMIVLSQYLPTNKRIIYYFEIEKLSLKLLQLLGNDADGFGVIEQSELEQDEWRGRKWKFDSVSFRLIRVQGKYQFYYDYTR